MIPSLTDAQSLSVDEFRARIDALLNDTARELERTRHFSALLQASAKAR